MRYTAGVLVALSALAGCSSSVTGDHVTTSTPAPAPTSTTRSAADVERDAISLVHAANPNIPDEQIRQAFSRVCDYITAHPNGQAILALRSEFVSRKVFDAPTATTLIGGAVAAKCPQHRPLLQGL
jgi:hypothetical protein